MRGRKNDTMYFWIFLAPALIAFIMVMIIPFFMGVFYSFTDWNGIRVKEFLGFENYRKMFSEDPRFLYSIIITVVYSTLNIVFMNVCALSLALLVTQKLKFRNFYRAGFFLPNLIGGLILGYIWQFIFSRFFPSFFNTDFLMLSDRNYATVALVIVGVWQYAGYLMIIYITGLQSIPESLFEAAMIDGASAWDRFRKITIPMIAPAFTVCTFISLLYSFKQYDVNYSLTYGGPSTMFMGRAMQGTELISMHIIKESEKVVKGVSQMAVAQSKSVLFFVALLVISLVQVYFNKKREVEM